MKNSKRITFNMFIKSNGKLNITVMEGKASKQDKSFEVVSGKTLTEMRQNAGIKDGAEWQITNRFDKRHVKPTLVEGESVYCFARAVKADETYYLAVIKTASGFRAVMHHKSKRNEYGVETQEVAKRFRTVATESTVKDVSGTVNTAKGGSFYNHALQVTSSFFCKKEAQKEVAPVVVEEVKEEVAVVESSEVEALKARIAELEAENASLKAELAAQETTFEVAAVEEKSIDEELEELLNYRWGVVAEVEQEVALVVVPVEVEAESAPVTNFESLRNNFMAKFKTTWEDTEEEQEEIEVNEDEIREAQMALHDAIYDTNYSAYAYAA
ncbi:TPA: ABC transporter C-terminal domain-containing protein [Escherichia coli]|uniref:ABC transporter C-terminal domain-containing protein n=1 Tax=Escherichia coli TaxID=562 RepID=UPI0037DD15BF